MKTSGQGKLCLFMHQSDIDKELNKLQAERLIKKLGLAKPEPKSIQGYEIPLIPKQEDFYLFPFRQISATVVGAHSYKATDFSVGNVLKKSTSLLYGKPAYLNHYQAVGEEIGTIGECEYTPPYKNSNGDQVPGGIEGPFVIDGVLQPKLVRQLSSPVSPIDSCSVTTIFEWEASHDFEHDGDFFWHLGEIVDKEMVRRIVTNVVSYEESSMVWMGADPYAKMLDEKGQVVDIDKAFAYARNTFFQDPDLRKYDSGRKFYVFDCLDNQKLLHLSKSSIDFSKAKTENDTHMNEDLIVFLASFFGTTPELIKTGKFSKVDAEKIITTDGFTKMKTNSENFEKATTEKVDLEKKVTTLNSEIVSLKADKKTLEDAAIVAKPKIEGFDALLVEAKKEAKRAYGLFSKGKPEKTIEDEIEAETSMEKFEAKIKMWGGTSVTEFGATCNKCQSKDISFRSSKPSKENETEGTGEELNMYTLAHD